ALLRWTVDGAVDGGFGNAGVAIAFADRPGAAQRLVRQPDGKLLAAGLLPTGASGPLVLARFLADGTTSTTGAPATTTTTMTRTALTTRAGASCTARAPRSHCARAAECDDGDGCTVDRCETGRCVHDPASGVDAVTCLCAAPLPACDRRGAARVARACCLVARAGT